MQMIRHLLLAQSPGSGSRIDSPAAYWGSGRADDERDQDVHHRPPAEEPPTCRGPLDLSRLSAAAPVLLTKNYENGNIKNMQIAEIDDGHHPQVQAAGRDQDQSVATHRARVQLDQWMVAITRASCCRLALTVWPAHSWKNM